MHRININCVMMMQVLIITSCIKSYDPQILSRDVQKYVVTGVVSDDGNPATVNVSLTSPLGKPKYLPVTGCRVTILDDLNHTFDLEDVGKGNYERMIDSSFLVSKSLFRVEVLTPEHDLIKSDFDTLTRCPAIDSLYYIRKDIEGNTPGDFTLGIQFYINLNGSISDSRFYRWEAYETWEYHTEYPLEWYYDGMIHHVVPPDFSRNICWITKLVPTVFTLPTDNLHENKYDAFPLHYVDNTTDRLVYGYSLLVKQISLSKTAFTYWDQLRINNEQQGGLYEKQPLAVKGNLHNTTHPENEVLGFFSVSSVKSKRIFIKDVPDLPLNVETHCGSVFLRGGLRQIPKDEYPGYLQGNESTYFPIWLDGECVNCLLLGGINVKPDFWPF